MRFLVTFALVICSLNFLFAQNLFKDYQSIPTHGATGLKSFNLDGQTYLAVGHYYNDTTYVINSQVLIWDGASFVPFQTLPTSGGVNPEYFEIGDQKFLAYCNYRKGSDYTINSTIFQWDGRKFVFFQDIPTSGAYRWEAIHIGDVHLLVVANQTNATGDWKTTNNSEVFKWDGTKFVSIQLISTSGATDLCHFTLASADYLAIAATYGTACPIYKWNGTQFISDQSLTSFAATGVDFFTIGGDSYVAVANGGSFNFQTFSTTKIGNSYIYKWNGTTFNNVQSIPTIGAFNMKPFSIGAEYFLAIANYTDDANIHNQNSPIYKWDGTKFALLESIPTFGATEWEPINIGTNFYLAVSNYEYNAAANKQSHNIDSKVYKYTPVVTDADVKVEQASVFYLESQKAFQITNPGNCTVSLVVSDVQGRVLFSKENISMGSGMYPIPMVLGNGIYVAQVRVGQEKAFQFKFFNTQN